MHINIQVYLATYMHYIIINHNTHIFIYLFICQLYSMHACVQITDKYSFVYSYYRHAEGMLAIYIGSPPNAMHSPIA